MQACLHTQIHVHANTYTHKLRIDSLTHRNICTHKSKHIQTCRRVHQPGAPAAETIRVGVRRVWAGEYDVW